MSVSGLSTCLEIRTFSIIFAKPVRMEDTLLILALPCSRSFWLFPMSMLWFSLNCGLRSWASQDVVQPFTPRLFMNAPKASWMCFSMHGMWILNARHSFLEASRVHFSSQLIKLIKEILSVAIQSIHLSVSSKCRSTYFKCMASIAPGCWPLTYHPELAFEIENK